jgi:NTP pyrophosphatase (non-canonical NTP hydrolase)
MNHHDTTTTIQDLKNAVKKFSDDREWAQFHTPHHMAMDISIEAAELLELFLWRDTTAIAQLLNNDATFKEHVQDELADVIHSCLGFANTVGLDITTIFFNKLEKTAHKYPIEEYKGKAFKR